jgi:catechol 2,3-dioxygenase-like lactoylglutathione lyase family enzyme
MKVQHALIVPLVLLTLTSLSGTARAASDGGGVVGYSHHHLNVTSVDEHKKFWVDTLAGTMTKVGSTDVVKFPGVLVFLRQQKPTGGSEPSAITHVGFFVKNATQLNDKFKAAGFKLLLEGPRVGLVVGPDDVVVECIESAAITVPITFHHVHLLTADMEKAQAWYVKVFDGKPGKRGQFLIVDVPGVNIAWMQTDKPVLPSKGRAIDHVSFEVQDLKEYCKALEARGVKFDQKYSKSKETGVASAFFTDPDGAYIELTEGTPR